MILTDQNKEFISWWTWWYEQDDSGGSKIDAYEGYKVGAEQTRKEASRIVRKILTEKWFTLGGVRIQIPMGEIESVCSAILGDSDKDGAKWE